MIWTVQEWSGERVSTKLLAERIGVRASTVSEAIRKLSDQGLVDHARYGSIALTDAGRRGRVDGAPAPAHRDVPRQRTRVRLGRGARRGGGSRARRLGPMIDRMDAKLGFTRARSARRSHSGRRRLGAHAAGPPAQRLPGRRSGRSPASPTPIRRCCATSTRSGSHSTPRSPSSNVATSPAPCRSGSTRGRTPSTSATLPHRPSGWSRLGSPHHVGGTDRNEVRDELSRPSDRRSAATVSAIGAVAVAGAGIASADEWPPVPPYPSATGPAEYYGFLRPPTRTLESVRQPQPADVTSAPAPASCAPASTASCPSAGRPTARKSAQAGPPADGLPRDRWGRTSPVACHVRLPGVHSAAEHLRYWRVAGRTTITELARRPRSCSSAMVWPVGSIAAYTPGCRPARASGPG